MLPEEALGYFQYNKQKSVVIIIFRVMFISYVVAIFIGGKVGRMLVFGCLLFGIILVVGFLIIVMSYEDLSNVL
jgi:Mn2+/Fe2+ NRAMP family transporter